MKYVISGIYLGTIRYNCMSYILVFKVPIGIEGVDNICKVMLRHHFTSGILVCGVVLMVGGGEGGGS